MFQRQTRDDGALPLSGDMRASTRRAMQQVTRIIMVSEQA
jgi:hypothetical protein